MEFEVDASSRISKLKIISQIDVKLFYNKRKFLIIIDTCTKFAWASQDKNCQRIILNLYLRRWLRLIESKSDRRQFGALNALFFDIRHIFFDSF